MPVGEATFKKVALSFPEAYEKSSYGQPAIFVAKKFFTRRRAEDNSVVWILDSIDQRDNLIAMDPETYFITDHYRNYATVLVRLSRIDVDLLRKMLERRWRDVAPKKLVKAMDETGAPPRGRSVQRPG